MASSLAQSVSGCPEKVRARREQQLTELETLVTDVARLETRFRMQIARLQTASASAEDNKATGEPRIAVDWSALIGRDALDKDEDRAKVLLAPTKPSVGAAGSSSSSNTSSSGKGEASKDSSSSGSSGKGEAAKEDGGKGEKATSTTTGGESETVTMRLEDEQRIRKMKRDFRRKMWSLARPNEPYKRKADEEEEDEDIEQIAAHNIFNCPLTATTFENPMKNTKCGHSYSKVAIENYIKHKAQEGKRRSKAKEKTEAVACPVAGCSKQVSLAWLERDVPLEVSLRRAKIAEISKSKTPDGDGGIDFTQNDSGSAPAESSQAVPSQQPPSPKRIKLERKGASQSQSQ